MKLAYFTMPLHPLGRDYTVTLKEDREAVLLADELGFEEAFFGEHTTDLLENIPSCLVFIASLIHDAKNITFGSATVNLPNHHPAAVASEVAMLDHMCEGRFIFGISPGGLKSDAEVYGNVDKNRTEMMVEAIDHILDIWTKEPPYNLQGRHWNITTEQTYEPDRGQGILLRPYQKPHPPIMVTVVEPYSKGITAAAKRGWTPASANFLLPQWVKTHWPKYVEGCAAAGRRADPRDWRVAKSVFVADDDRTARRYGKGKDGPYYHYYEQLMHKLIKAGRANLFKYDRNEPDEAVSTARSMDDLVICGTVDNVVEQILAYREYIGDFGTLLYAGHDWKDKTLARRSMELMATKVIPAVNRAIGQPQAAE